jgi:hypothetical protein
MMRINQPNSRAATGLCIRPGRVFICIALVAVCVLAVTQKGVADGPWICNEREIGCFHPNWMDSLDGSLLISEISVPGTHETMASQSGGPSVYCQSVQDLRKQLDAGIRAIDLRCRPVYDRFAIHHADYYQEAYFGEPLNIPGHQDYGDQNVMQKCVQFLYDNPSEFILMRIAHGRNTSGPLSEDNCSRSFSETFEWYREDDGCHISATSGDSIVNYKDYIWATSNYLPDEYPTIDEVRGKIVILQDFATRYQVGNAPRRVIAADLDRNGYDDIVTVNVDDDNVAVLLNKGDRTFEKKHFYIGGGPRDVCAVDLNMDDWLDLAVVKYNNPGHNYMAILFNRCDGTGNFWSYVDHYVEDDPIAITATDPNHDGLPDLLIAGQASSEITLMINRSDAPGSFLRSDYYCGGGPRDLVSADFDGNGWPDIALVKFNNPGGNYMAVFLHNGVDTWYNFVDYEVEDDPVAITVTDPNHDGLPDLLIAGQASNEITLMINRSDAPGSFLRSDYYCGGGPRDLVSADFDGNGWPDIALVKYNNPGHNYMAVFLHNGVDTWYDFTDYYTGDDPHGICAADLDLDGDLELITSAISERRIEIFDGDGSGAFYSARLGYPWAIFNIQDDYSMSFTTGSFNSKWTKIKNQIDNARLGDPEKLYINFTSGSGGVYPYTAADGEPAVGQGMNQRTYDYLNSFLPENAERCGVIMMDYPGPGLIEAIINQNSLMPTSVEDDNDGTLPLSFQIYQNYPNPFNPMTKIKYSLPQRSHLKIEVYNVLGQRVRTLVDREESAGSYTVNWDGKAEDGQAVSTGVYLYRFQAGEYVQTKKMVLLK